MKKEYYRRIENGGYNPCIYGNTAKIPRHAEYDVLPNCVGYAVGRFNEIANANSCKYLGNSNANWFMNWAKKQGLETGTKPKVGACIVWDDGNCGHVAIVEQVKSDNEIILSQSGWNAKSYYWNARHYSNNNWCAGDDYYWMGNSYKFLGFIYNPNIKDKTLPKTVEENKEVDQLKVNWASTMRVRLGHSTNDEVIGFAEIGYYNILSTHENDYLWVEVEKDKWIAVLEPQCEYVKKCEEIPEISTEEENDTNTLPSIETSEKEQEVEEIDIHNKDKENVLIWLIQILYKIFKKMFMKD